VALCISRNSIGWASVVYALSVGWFIDIYGYLYSILSIHSLTFMSRIVYILVGQACLVVAYSLLIKHREGMNQMDAIATGISKKTSIGYKYVRTGMDAVFLVCGWFMGGVVGIGSVLTMMTTGFLVDCISKKEK